MKQLITSVITIVLFSTQILAQKDSIHFEHGTWQEVLAIAKKSNKPIYIDFYTTWCGPCKMMASKYFKDSTAASWYNSRFVNYKLDAEKGEGIELAKKYKVSGYPTNVFVDPNNEKLIYKTSGCPTELNGFLNNANIAIQEQHDPMNVEDYYQKFKSNDYDSVFLQKFIEKNNRIGLNNNEPVDTFLLKYAGNYSDAERFNFIYSNFRNITAPSLAFKYLLRLVQNSSLPKEEVDQVIQRITYNTVEYAQSTFKEKDFDTAAYYMTKYYEDGYDYMFEIWNEYRLEQKNMYKLKLLYNEYGPYFFGMTDDYIQKKNEYMLDLNVKKQLEWAKTEDKEQKVSEEYLRELFIKEGLHKMYSSRVANYLNTICWTIYEKMPKDNDMVKKAIPWAKRAMDVSKYNTEVWIAIADTYARLLATAGDKKSAIAVMKEAITEGKKIKYNKLAELEKYMAELKK